MKKMMSGLALAARMIAVFQMREVIVGLTSPIQNTNIRSNFFRRTRMNLKSQAVERFENLISLIDNSSDIKLSL
jgi:hypothetical protein